ncbi:unnamed protein product [Auanema sp. JU1783]|nr:unnamed protein product [Auanema sp. JU1783]
MGNILVSYSESWSICVFSQTVLWCCFVLYLIFKFVIFKPWSSATYQRRALERVSKKRTDEFHQWKELVETDDEDIIAQRKKIVSLSLFELREKLQKEELTASETLTAYIWKMLQVQERINCCTVIIKEAVELAKSLDEKWAGRSDKPTLFGIPFSVKDNFYMDGYDCAVGLAKFVEQPKSTDCSFVVHLTNLGGVPFVRTNVPQALLSFVCSNSVYGTTLNPHDVTRTPGGSSGGEAALLAAGGTPFAIGSDLAGSLRIPAVMCGITTLKPTQDRFVVTGSHGGVPGRSRLGLSFGFFSKSVEEQIFLLKTTLGTSEYREVTPLSVYSPLIDSKLEAQRPLRIGYFDFDGFSLPVPSMRRAVIDTVEKLKASGHTMVRFTVPDVDVMANLLYKEVMPDGGAYARSLFENDIVDPYMKQFATLLKIPRCLRWVSCIISRISPQLALIAQSYVGGLEDLRITNEQVDEYRLKFVDYWKSSGVDALICPGFLTPAVPHNYPSRMALAAVSTGIFNLIDFPAGVVPTGAVTSEDDDALMNEKEFPVGYNFAQRIVREACTKTVGLPIGVQVVTLPFEEELCLRLMGEVEKLWAN